MYIRYSKDSVENGRANGDHSGLGDLISGLAISRIPQPVICSPDFNVIISESSEFVLFRNRPSRSCITYIGSKEWECSKEIAIS